MSTIREYRWEPAARNACVGHGPGRRLDGRPGDVVRLGPEHAERVNRIVPGVDGAPALIPVSPVAPPLAPSEPAPAPAPTRAPAHPSRKKKPTRKPKG